MKYLAILMVGFVLAQAAEYGSGACVDAMQKKCYPLWTKGKRQEYQSCMDNEKRLSAASDILGFNFIYKTRKLIWGY